jgi:hypothetical protein
MNRHSRFQKMLLFPHDLTLPESNELGRHLAECVRCRKDQAMIRTAQSALEGLRHVPTPTTLAEGLRKRASQRHSLKTPKGIWHGRRIGLAAIACAAVVIAAVFGVFGQQRPATVSAYAILVRAGQQPTSGLYPFSGSSRVSFTETPWYLLPPRVADYAGHHVITAQWWVEDANHFRVDIHVLQPALERGAITAVLNDGMFTVYDARSGRATVLRREPLRQLSMTAPALLSFLQNGAQPNGLYTRSPLSITGYLASHANRSRLGVASYARIVRQTRMLGHPVDVIEFGPLTVMSYDSNGCYGSSTGGPQGTPVVHPPAGPCHHYRQSMGWARVFIERDDLLVLRFEEHGVNDIENPLGLSVRYLYQVTSLRMHTGPSRSALSYRPPIAPLVTRVRQPQPARVSTSQGADDLTAPGFIGRLQPTTDALSAYSRLATTYFAQQLGGSFYHYAEPPLPVIRGMDVLFAEVHHWVKVYTAWHGRASIYVTGPYLLVQERQLAKGLPGSFTQGAPIQVATCRAWTGAYADGQHWIAFQRSRASIVVSSNVLSTRRLVEYVSKDVCR